MELIRFFLDLTPHQLDVIRTVSTLIGVCIVPVLGFLLGWGIKLLRRVIKSSQSIITNTQREERINGKLHRVSVAEDMKRAMYNTEELAHLVADTPRVHGRRRGTPSNAIPTISHYEGVSDE